MFLFSLLDASAKTTNIVKWISVAVSVILLGVIAFLGYMNRGKKKYDAKRISFAGLCVATSFVLSTYAKFSPVTYGGSITIAGLVPLLIYAYAYGVADGILVGIVHGLLDFAFEPYILTPMTFVLDYILAFAAIGVMGLAKKFTRKTTFNVVLGTVAVFAVRFLFHLISGFVYFANDSIWVSLPSWAMSNAFIYSFIYQCVYLPADCLIAAVAMYILAKTNVLDRLINIMRPKKAIATATASETPKNEKSATTAASEEIAATDKKSDR